jgi:photosystem II stability/assembly factor-like uncharacterized protein
MTHTITFRIELLLALGLMCSGCFPERFPVAPENYENRRPQILYVQPEDGKLNALPSDSIKIWFDELMNVESVVNSLSLELVKTIDDETNEEWSLVDTIASFAHSPSNPQLMFIGLGQKGAMQSTNGGERWTFLKSIAFARWIRAAYNPQNPLILLAVSSSNKVYRTSDGGASWNPATGLPSDTLVRITALRFDVGNPQHVWLGVQRILPNGTPDNTFRDGVWRSSDGGATWQRTVTNLPNWDSRFAVSGISVHPTNSSLVYVSTRGRAAYRTTDGGTSWTQFTTANGFPTLQLTDITFASNNPALIYAATNTQGIFQTTNDGLTWTRIGGALAGGTLQSTATGRLYNTLNAQVFVLRDTVWNELPLPLQGGESVLGFFAQSDAQFSLGTSRVVFRSENGGASWMEKNQIEKSSIRVSFRSIIETEWQEELTFINEGDTVRIKPYRYDDVLAQYDAGFVSVPPVDPNPKATHLTFVPSEPLLNQWRYRLRVQGAFQGNVFLGNIGAKDRNGLSMLEDRIFGFIVNTLTN